jgi:carbamate kinase
MVANNLIIVALGGNAISKPNEEGNVKQQFVQSRITAQQLADLHDAGHHLVITHGNGPQIGNFLLRNEAAAGAIYPLPMEVAVAHVQGGMGYMIAQTVRNELVRRGHDAAVTSVVTTVLVDRADPSFQSPSKPIGRVLTRQQAEHWQREEGWTFKEVSPDKFRRVVASPTPLQIMEIEHIRRAVMADELIVACGGGGIPVVRDEAGELRGAKAVIDKDLASALLARDLGARSLLILTNVNRVCLNFGLPSQRELDRMSLAEAEGWLKDDQFGAGSMGPKVRGCIEFLRGAVDPDAFAAIGPLERAADILAGEIGTRITR